MVPKHIHYVTRFSSTNPTMTLPVIYKPSENVSFNDADPFWRLITVEGAITKLFLLARIVLIMYFDEENVLLFFIQVNGSVLPKGFARDRAKIEDQKKPHDP